MRYSVKWILTVVVTLAVTSFKMATARVSATPQKR
jgi:hypothetical protein